VFRRGRCGSEQKQFPSSYDTSRHRGPSVRVQQRPALSFPCAELDRWWEAESRDPQEQIQDLKHHLKHLSEGLGGPQKEFTTRPGSLLSGPCLLPLGEEGRFGWGRSLQVLLVAVAGLLPPQLPGTAVLITGMKQEGWGCQGLSAPHAWAASARVPILGRQGEEAYGQSTESREEAGGFSWLPGHPQCTALKHLSISEAPFPTVHHVHSESLLLPQRPLLSAAHSIF
jgi:hypothetical protein